jgi:hypothetical protein
MDSRGLTPDQDSNIHACLLPTKWVPVVLQARNLKVEAHILLELIHIPSTGS